MGHTIRTYEGIDLPNVFLEEGYKPTLICPKVNAMFEQVFWPTESRDYKEVVKNYERQK